MAARKNKTKQKKKTNKQKKKKLQMMQFVNKFFSQTHIWEKKFNKKKKD